MKIFLFLTGILLCLAPLACQKTYTLGPLPAPTPTPGPTATPSCAPLTQTACSSGIMWNNGTVTASNGGYTAWINLAVNCAPDPTAAITLTGPSVNLPLNFVANFPILGSTYGYYLSSASGSLTPGATYTLTSVTSMGTASASLVLPPAPIVAADGSTATWTGSCQFKTASVFFNTSYVYYSGTCWSLTSPFSYPASAYSTPGYYQVYAYASNYTVNISGGTGLFLLNNETSQSVTK